MKIRTWIRTLSLSALAVAIAVVAAPTMEAGEHGWNVRAEGVNADTSLGERVYTGDGAAIDISASGDTGWGITVGYRFSDHVGWELGALQMRPSMKLETDFGLGGATSSFESDLRARAFVAALNFHLTPNRAIDIYLSPILASISYGSLDYTVDVPDGETQALALDVNRDTAWGLGLGIEVPFGEGGWRATGSVRYLDSAIDIVETQGEFADTFNFDMTLISVGIGYQF